MPCTLWEDIAGKKCSCGNYATHYYGSEAICCQCHGGNLVTPEEAKREVERILLKEDDEFHKKLSNNLDEIEPY